MKRLILMMLALAVAGGGFPESVRAGRTTEGYGSHFLVAKSQKGGQKKGGQKKGGQKKGGQKKGQKKK